MFPKRREKVSKRVAKFSNSMAAIGRGVASIQDRDAASKKDPWAPSRHDAGSTDWRTSHYSKDAEGNTFKNNVRKIRKGSKPLSPKNPEGK